MASPAAGAPATDAGRQTTTKYYFAYGSNLHLQQMKKRCPGSKFIGSGQLRDHRWQINERGYANVVECQGHWVEGLVYEINARDEARLDINEGVSKDAYQKQYMAIMLRRADSALYRRPVPWIVNNGGPEEARHVAQQGGGQKKAINHNPHWEQNILVYISPRYIVDSKPKEEYINRINAGIADAKALGVTNDYISNCVRPFVPASTPSGQDSTKKETAGAAAKTTTTTTAGTTAAQKPKIVTKVPSAKKIRQPAREVKRTTPTPTPTRSAEPSPNRASRQTPAPRPAQQQPQGIDIQRLTRNAVSNIPDRIRRAQQQARSYAAAMPPLPPRPLSQNYAGHTLQVPTSSRRPASDVGAPPPLPSRTHRR
ncbi:hypothetical protein F66182_10800, partial [Fusarium sp. NRRL 66182]